MERIRGNYAGAIAHFQKLDPAVLPGQSTYEVGVVHAVGKNKRAAPEQCQQLVNLKSPLAAELLAMINDIK